MAKTSFFASVVHGLTGIFRFSGRDTRRQFWQFAAFLFVPLLFVPAPPLLDLYREMSSADRAAFVARIAQTPELLAFFNLNEMQATFAIIRQLFLGLLVAAMVRRLHDVGRSGVHALVNVLISLWALAAGLCATWDFGQPRQTMDVAGNIMSAASLIWIAHFLYLMVQLIRPSDPEFNHGGDAIESERQVQIATLRRTDYGWFRQNP